MKEEMEVVSFRVPKKLKKEMASIDTNWSEEVRKLIEVALRKQRRKRALSEAIKILDATHAAPVGAAARYIREDRDSS